MLLLLHKDVLEVNQLRRPSPSPDSFPTGGLSSRLRRIQLQKAKAEASHRGVSAFPGASGSCPRACRCWGLLPAQNRHRGCPALRNRASESKQTEGTATPDGGVSSSPWGLWGGGEGSTGGKHPKKQQGQETGTPRKVLGSSPVPSPPRGHGRDPVRQLLGEREAFREAGTQQRCRAALPQVRT